MFREPFMHSYTITSKYTERKFSKFGREFHVDNGSAQKFISPRNRISIFQTNNGIGIPDTANNPAVFDTYRVKNTSMKSTKLGTLKTAF